MLFFTISENGAHSISAVTVLLDMGLLSLFMNVFFGLKGLIGGISCFNFGEVCGEFSTWVINDISVPEFIEFIGYY